MNTSEKVIFYQKELAKNKRNPNSFNLWAFLFSSFYFFYINTPVLFCLFIFLPFLCAIPFALVMNSESAIMIGFLISHLIAGLVANPYYIKYQKKFIEQHKDVDVTKPVEYFAISITRFLICMILSGGLYVLYWGYKNWKSYQETTKDAVAPFIRAFFIHLTAPSLCYKMNYTLKVSRWLLMCGVSFLILEIFDRILIFGINKQSIPDSWLATAGLAVLALIFIEPLCFIPVQLAVNKHTTETLKKTLNKHFFPWEIVILLIGTWFNYTTWFGNPFKHQLPFTVEQSEKIGLATGFIYRHTQGYTNVCAEQGYNMHKYPEDFKNYVADDIAHIEAEIAPYGYNIARFQNEIMTEKVQTTMRTSIYNELEQLRRFHILSFLAEKEGRALEEMEWDEKYKELLPLYAVCKDYDENGIEMLKNGPNKYLLKQIAEEISNK